MNSVHNLLEKFFSKFYENEYSKFILEQKFNTPLTSLIQYIFILNFLIFAFISFIGIFWSQNNSILAGMFLIPISLYGARKIFEEIIMNEIQQFDLDCIFILRELVVISTTTKSEAQAYFLLASNSNKILKNIGELAFIERNINPSTTIEIISSHLNKLHSSQVQTYLQSIFKNWNYSQKDVSAYSKNFQKIMQTKLDEDLQGLDSKVTFINAIIGVFPIFVTFLIFIGFKTIHPLFEVILISFFVILLLIWLIDPLHYGPLIDFFGSSKHIEDFNGSTILQEFFAYLLQTQNFSKSLQEFIIHSAEFNRSQKYDFLLFMNFMDNTRE